MSQQAVVTKPKDQKIPLFASIWLAAFCSMCAMRVCDAMLPALERDFSAPTTSVAACISAFAIAYGCMQLVYGPLADYLGKPRVIAWVCIGCVVGLTFASFAPTLLTLIAARALTGMTAAGIIPVAMAYIGDNSSNDNRQAALANFISATILGSVAGQMVGAVASDTIGWRWAFALLAVLFALAAWNLRACLRAAGPKTTSQSPNAAVLFGFTQYRKAFTTRGMPLFLALTFFQGAVNFAGMSFVPSFVHDHFGVSLTLASTVVVCFALGGLLYSRTARFLLGRFSVSQLALAGGLFQAISFGSMVLVPSWSAALAFGFFGGFGATMFHNSLQTQATKMVPGSTGTSVSTFAMTLFMGQAMGVSAIATIFTQSASKAMFVLCACSIVLAIAVYLRFRWSPKPDRQT